MLVVWMRLEVERKAFWDAGILGNFILSIRLGRWSVSTPQFDGPTGRTLVPGRLTCSCSKIEQVKTSKLYVDTDITV